MVKIFILTITCPISALSHVTDALSDQGAELVDARLVDETPSMQPVPKDRQLGALELIANAVMEVPIGQTFALRQIQNLMIRAKFNRHSSSARLSEMVRAGAITLIGSGVFKVVSHMTAAEIKARAFPNRKRN